jgi:diguanylate cyclase
MSADHDWREKYREALSRLAEEEERSVKTQNVLKLLIGRLCLAAQGRDARLDQEIARVTETVRQRIDASSVEALLGPLSEAVAALDRHERPAAAHAPPAAEAARPASGAPAAPQAHVEPPAAASPSAATTSNGSPSSATPADGELDSTTVLDRLALLPELKPVVTELRSRRRETLNLREMAELLERVTRYATEQRAQVQREKLELESLVQQTAARLEEITSHLAGEMADRNASQEDTQKLNALVTDEVEQIRLTAAGAADVSTLRHQLTARLDAISNHLIQFQMREDARVRTYRDRVQRMRARIAVLERESRTLQENLREEQRMAMIDALTGIPNRAAYDDRIEEEFKRWKRFARPVSILAWDIDRFKAINDAYGHKAGDKVLRVIGQHLARHVRDTDFVGRYGGEEFVMLLVGTRAEEARAVADKIRLEIAQLGFHFHDQPVAVTASCGITEFTGSDTPDIIFDRADRALYQAKQAGRNCCVVS